MIQRGMILFSALLLAACSNDPDATPGDRDAAPTDAAAGDAGQQASDGGGDITVPARCNGSVASTSSPATGVPGTPALTVPTGFSLQVIAAVPGARQLAALPNGDLLVGTSGSSVYLVPNADRASGAGAPVVFTTINDAPVQGVAFAASTCTVYVASQRGIYAIPYQDAQQSGAPGAPIAQVRPQGGGGHTTTSVAYSAGVLYAGVGSSCNACVESDPTRATIQAMNPDGTNMTTRASRIRNAIALAVNPATGTLWAGVAGQDDLPTGHPYEFFDGVTLHPGVPDYGWPDCEENQKAYTPGADCSQVVVPRVALPAYSTPIGAAFYPANPGGANAFPASYRGGAFIGLHGAWHKVNGTFYSPPLVAFVPMSADTPSTAADWSDPAVQWTEFVGGCQLPDGVTRIARPTGVAVGRDGTLFLADDQNGYVYSVTPS